MGYNWISLPSNLQYQLVGKKGWIVWIYARRQTPQSNIGNPLDGWRSVGFINIDPSRGIHLIRPRNVRYPLPANITPLINHDPAFFLMRSQPSGPPPVCANGDDHMMSSRQYGHVHKRILLLREYYVKTIRQNPPISSLDYVSTTDLTFLSLCPPSLSPWNFWHMKLMDRSKKLFVAIAHAEHSSRSSPHVFGRYVREE